MNNDKHVFRLYAVDGDSLYSPYGYSEEPQTTLGMPHKAKETLPDHDMTANGRLLHKGKIYPRSNMHYGFSVIGRPDPRYSIYTVDNPFADTSDTVLEAMDNEITSHVPESAKESHSLSHMYADGEKNDYEYLTNRLYSQRERLSGLSTYLTGDEKGVTHMTIDPKWLNFDSDETWDNFVDTLYRYSDDNRAFDGGRDDVRMFLASVPESKLLSIDDVVNKGLTFQRDWPEELVTSEVTPIKDIGDMEAAYTKYTDSRRKGAKADDAFGEAFKIAPSSVISDALKKNIYKDMSSCYHAKRKQLNLLKGIRGLGQ